ncbi:hypothetical protein BG015_010238 [Linnemannia schmuckeri]|uniref:F-box domain-containing protein n=1 Tax=Linnemannia schmuckeri TaxID=64567 RepID=A0A9P5RUR9_9FUNG|nr:hypothetical protein BG015_010238 [Linnemannia schmuckeri]
MAYITDLPEEVITCIGNFLTKRDIVIIVRTCRLLHQSLSHLIWKDVTLQTGKLPIDVTRLQTNADSVQRLHNFGTIPPEYYRIVFPGLYSLEIHFKGANPTRRAQGSVLQEVNNTALIRLNPTIQDLTIHLANHTPSNDFWDAITTTLRQPRSLRLTGVFDLLGRAPVNAFWGTCAQFREIACFGRDGLLSDLVPPMTFPGLDRITLGINTAHSDINNTIIHLEWLKRCPNLTKMRWEMAGSEFPIPQFAIALEQMTWRQLQELCLTGVPESDEFLSAVMRRLPALTSLEVDAKAFGPQCFNWLRIRQFAGIRVLHLRECIQVTSPMVLEILHNCIQLEDLEAFHVAFSDLQSSSQPWVCRRLKRLRLYFDNDIKNDNLFSPTVFWHLSRLEQLEDLDVDEDFMWEYSSIETTETTTTTTTSTPIPLKKQGPSIQWRLDSGLGQMTNSRRLRSVRVEKTFDTARPEDIEWMLKHWPRLREFTGPLTKDSEDWEAMFELFEARSVRNDNIHFTPRFYDCRYGFPSS